MNHRSNEIATSESTVLTVLAQLKSGEVREAVDFFADGFKFEDCGIRLEFSDKKKLTEFFQKTRQTYSDSVLLTETVLVAGDHVFLEWTQRNTITEAFYGGLMRRLPVTVRGSSFVRIEGGKITAAGRLWRSISPIGWSPEAHRSAPVPEPSTGRTKAGRVAEDTHNPPTSSTCYGYFTA